MTLVISAFPGTGKSYVKENRTDITVWDSDSSDYSKSPDFPQNYIDHIKSGIEQGVDVILVSTHKAVRDALRDNGIKFSVIIPEIQLKEEYIQRYKDRKSSEALISVIEANWDGWINEIISESLDKRTPTFYMYEGEYLMDIMFEIVQYSLTGLTD